MPTCSVIVPAFNAERYVGQAIESALAQTHSDTEVIVVDDGSTDATASVIKRFGPQVRCIQQRQSGPAAARNTAVRAANGDYIALLDADDYWLPRRLERMIACLESRPSIGFATSNAFLVYGDTASPDLYYGRLPRCHFRNHDQAFWITQYNFVFTSTVVRKRLFEKYGDFDGLTSPSEDWDLWTRFLIGGETVTLVPEVLAYYRIRPGSLTTNNRAIFGSAVAVLENAIAQPGGTSVPGLEGTLALMRGGLALGKGRLPEALHWFSIAARDRTLPVARRAQGLLAGVLPRLAWRFQMASAARTAATVQEAAPVARLYP